MIIDVPVWATVIVTAASIASAWRISSRTVIADTRKRMEEMQQEIEELQRRDKDRQRKIEALELELQAKDRQLWALLGAKLQGGSAHGTI